MDCTVYFTPIKEGGPRYVNLLGAVLIRQKELEDVQRRLENAINNANLETCTLDWNTVNNGSIGFYKHVFTEFFSLIKLGAVKTRISFIQNLMLGPGKGVKPSLSDHIQRLLIDQFGLYFVKEPLTPIDLNLHFEKLPVELSELEEVIQLRFDAKRFSGLKIQEFKGQAPFVLQCLNCLVDGLAEHQNSPQNFNPSQQTMFKQIMDELVGIRPYFNIGRSTGIDGQPSNRWEHKYRHCEMEIYGRS